MDKFIFSTYIKTEGCDGYLDTWAVDSLTDFAEQFESIYKDELYSVFEYEVASLKVEEFQLRKYVKDIISSLIKKYQDLVDE